MENFKNLSQFHGTGVAIVTPFQNQNIDWENLARLIDHCIKGGVNYIVSLGSTGEAITLSPEEQQEVLAYTKEQIQGRVPLVVGIGGSNTKEIIERFQYFNLENVDAILSSSPAYNKPSQEGIYAHYMALDKASPLPVIMYNVPGRTGSNMSAETTLKIANESNNIIGIKEASGDLVQITKIIRGRPEDFLVISGDDPTALATVLLGGEGVISVIANAFPESFSYMIQDALEGHIDAANKANLETILLHDYLYKEGNPVGIKAVLSLLGLCEDEVRLPLVSASPALKDDIKRVFPI